MGPGPSNPNVELLVEISRSLLSDTRGRLHRATEEGQALYATLARFVLFYEFEPELKPLAIESLRLDRERSVASHSEQRVQSYERFVLRVEELVPHSLRRSALMDPSPHLFALAFQLSRAFQALFRSIRGASALSQELRASVWNSVFTADRRRYERALFERMHETSTLILGPSGTGKELVATAIGASRYVSFDEKRRRFTEDIAGSFLPLNVAALPAQLVEAELFGHKKGAFSGAVMDRVGFLESCPEHGTLFLDEIGELSVDLQIKLLRTLQTRRFFRVGETAEREFSGKLVSATNRDLQLAQREGRMRSDFYYRICADVVHTPALREQLADRPEDLQLLVQNVCDRLLPTQEVDAFAEQAVTILQQAGALEYAWPGNVRQLEQCVRAILVRGKLPTWPAAEPSVDAVTREERSLHEVLAASELSAEDLIEHYARAVYEQTGNYSETARRLGLDRRTIKAKVLAD
jgi:transcriptional regulator with PAS, ATPase and Fis domain